MPDSDGTAGYAYSVEMAARWLLQRLTDADGDIAYSVETLAGSAQWGLDIGGVDRFTPRAGQAPPPGPSTSDEVDVLSMIAAQLNAAGTLLAASCATECGAGPADRAASEQGVIHLRSVTRELQHDRDEAPSAAFAPVINRSPNASVAAGRLRQEADTVDTLAVCAAADLAVLSERFEHVMTKAELVLAAPASAGHVLKVIPPVAAGLPVFLPAASLVTMAAVVVIACDYVDSGSLLGLVDGVRHVVAAACRAVS
jgi:hypothetical protein